MRGADAAHVQKVQSSAAGIRDLNDSVQKIGAIANSIKEIADQTNLLALMRPSKRRVPASRGAASPW